MPHTITATNGAGSTAPTSVEDYSSSLSSRTVIQDLLDGSLGIAYIAPRPRSGSLRLVYLDRAQAFAALTLHRQPTSFTLVTTPTTEVSMTYAVDGSLDISQDAGVGVWYVTVGFQEVA